MIGARLTALGPKKKRWLALAAAGAVLVVVVTLFAGKPEKEEPRGRGETIRHVITDRDTRAIGINALSAEVKMLVRENADLKKTIGGLEKKLERHAPPDGKTAGLAEELTRLRRDLDDLKRDGAGTAKASASGGRTRNVFPARRMPPPLPPTGKPPWRGPGRIPARFSVTRVRPPPVVAKTPAQGARRDPFPAVLRVRREAILPNLFRADVRECFLIVSGYGSLSAERAYLRGETLSCVREDGGVMEARLDAYVVGEDGKTGVRGRVVSKQGQIIAKSLAAGFLGGVSKAFDANPVPVLATAPGGDALYQSLFSKKMLQGSAAKGMSKALDRIAQFYIDMAEEMFPVVEVDAGREVDIVVTRGAALQLRSNGRAGT